MPILLKNGAGEQANFSLRLKPAYKARGVIANFEPYVTAKFELLLGEEDIAANRVALQASSGQFEINDVTAGSYRIRVTQGSGSTAARAELPLSVSTNDIDSVSLQLSQAVPVKVETSWSEPQTKDSGSCSLSVSNPGTPIRKGLRREQTLLFPGTYPFSVVCFGGYAAAVTASNADILSSGKLVISPGLTELTVAIQAKSDGATLEVIFTGQETNGPFVAFLVPETPTAAGPLRRFAFQGGSEPFEGLAPGDYQLFLFPQSKDLSTVNELEYSNPDVVRQWTGGTRVRLAPGAHEKVTVSAFSK